MKHKSKKASASNGKRDKAKKGSSGRNGNPEWEHLEERFNTLSSDFNQLAEMVERED
ncbi:MAG: hypothetical protein HY922_06160 [Elusimicrobia bacterium]|nr:hypothetical protein [Elusimicrobiota bacterium]